MQNIKMQNHFINQTMHGLVQYHTLLQTCLVLSY